MPAPRAAKELRPTSTVKGETKKEEEDKNPEQENLSENKPESEQDQEPVKESEVWIMRLREDCIVTLGGHRQTLKAGLVLDTNNYDPAQLKVFGAKLDVIDEEGNVVLDLDTVDL